MKDMQVEGISCISRDASPLRSRQEAKNDKGPVPFGSPKAFGRPVLLDLTPYLESRRDDEYCEDLRIWCPGQKKPLSETEYQDISGF